MTEPILYRDTVRVADDVSPDDAGVQTRTWTRDFPADQPDVLCDVEMAAELLKGVDLRGFRHAPLARVAVQHARNAVADALEAHEKAEEAVVEAAASLRALYHRKG